MPPRSERTVGPPGSSGKSEVMSAFLVFVQLERKVDPQVLSPLYSCSAICHLASGDTAQLLTDPAYCRAPV